MIVLTGATGQLCRAVVQTLLQSMPASQLAVSVRDPAKAGDLMALGVDVRQGDFARPETLDLAFAGADILFLVSSNAAATGGDPLVQHRFGQLWLKLRPAAVLADHAARELDRLFRLGSAVTARERGELAVAVAEAKVLAHTAGIDVSNQMFELTGARSTSARYGYDRFWRNVRVHTLHDPVDYKIRDLGRYALDGSVPEPTAYS